MRAIGPVNFPLDLDPMIFEMSTPIFDLLRLDGKSSMPFALGPMGGRFDLLRSALGPRGFGIEEQEHAIAATEEGVTPLLLGDQFQSKDIAIESLGGFEVRSVQTGFEDTSRYHTKREQNALTRKCRT